MIQYVAAAKALDSDFDLNRLRSQLRLAIVIRALNFVRQLLLDAQPILTIEQLLHISARQSSSNARCF
jgi:hypothetical protein